MRTPAPLPAFTTQCYPERSPDEKGTKTVSIQGQFILTRRKGARSGAPLFLFRAAAPSVYRYLSNHSNICCFIWSVYTCPVSG